jgi:hypothetical protein
MKKVAFIALAFVLAFGLGGCSLLGLSSGGNNNNNNNNGSTTAIHLSENMTTSTTLDSSKVYVVDSWFYVEATLTIPAGTVIKFKPDTYIIVSGTGSVIAVGSPASRITFTAYTDDSVGGDTDGATSTGTSGYWAGIDAGTSGNQFQYADFKYATTGLNIGSKQIAVGNDQFLYCSAYGLDAGNAPKATTIANNRFYGNDKPVLISGTVSFDNTNTFTNGAATVKNTHQGIYLDNDNIEGTVAWSNVQVPYVVQSWEYVEGTFSISPSVIIKFMPDTYFQANGTGAINAVGGASTRITFTAYADDIGGDTNANGTVTTGTAGYWGGLSATTAGNQLQFVDILYATTGLDIGSGQIAVDNDQFLYCSMYGLNARDAPATTAITNNTFYGNEKPVLISGTVSFDNTNLFANGLATITNTYQGIFLDNDNIEGAVTWSNSRVPYVVQSWEYIGGTFTIGANVIVKFFEGTYLEKNGGTLSDDATDIYTAYTDDRYGGDTNADGTGTGPTAGYWGGLTGGVVPLGSVHCVSGI